MTLTRSFPTQNPAGLPITDTRRVTSGLVVRNADGTPRPGVFAAQATPIVAGRASMGYDVAPFLAATSRVNTGVELIANDAVTVVATTAAPASNSRIDVIWVRSQFVQHADANNDVVFGVTQGTAAAVPAKPAIPTGALELATAEILSTATTTATAVITQTHPFTAAAGGIVPFRNLTELNAWTAPPGQYAQNLATGAMYVRASGGWQSTHPGIGMRRANLAGTVSNLDFTNLSGNGFWTQAFRDGFAAYANGIVIPASGTYRISYGVGAIQDVLAGITINKSTGVVLGDLEVVSSSELVQGIAVATASAEVALLAGDTLRLWGIASAAGASWRTEAGLSYFQASFVRP